MAKNYSNFTKEELLEEVKKLEKGKKYGLVWEDKPEKVAEMCKEKLPILEEDRIREIITDTEKPFNILIEGDNYHALSVLNYTHQGKIDVIYIDPPYNTGSRDWKYNNSYVDSEDAYRHSKWLSFMAKRLKLAKNLLQNNGVICVTIDNYELYSLGLLMDEIFGERNKIGIICVEHNPQGRTFSKYLSTTHEYYLFYAKDINNVEIQNLPIVDEEIEKFKYKDSISSYKRIPLQKSGFASRRTDRPTQFFPFYLNTKTFELSLDKKDHWEKIIPINKFGEEGIWRNSFENCKNLIQNNDIDVIKHGNKYVLYKKYRIDIGKKPTTIWKGSRYVASVHGASLLTKLLGGKDKFQFPKSLFAVEDSIKLMSGDKNATILDFFAGSGTTAHAVLELNKSDGGNRKFVLCTNNENNICTEICYPRVKRVIQNLENESKGKLIKNPPGNLKYFKTDFVDAELTDKNKERMVKKSTEMLCLKEACFEEKTHGGNFKIFTDNKEKMLGIVYGDDGIDNIKKVIAKLNKKLIVYVFSLDDSAREEEFEDVKDLVDLRPIPAVILNVYRRIFK